MSSPYLPFKIYRQELPKALQNSLSFQVNSNALVCVFALKTTLALAHSCTFLQGFTGELFSKEQWLTTIAAPVSGIIPSQPCVTFHIRTSYLICTANQMTGSYMDLTLDCNSKAGNDSGNNKMFSPLKKVFYAWGSKVNFPKSFYIWIFETEILLGILLGTTIT